VSAIDDISYELPRLGVTPSHSLVECGGLADITAAMPVSNKSICLSGFAPLKLLQAPRSYHTTPTALPWPQIASRPVTKRLFSFTSGLIMEVELTAPNGKKWTQPLGLFINNEFVKSSNDTKIVSINPA
jgi:hypothetical protein